MRWACARATKRRVNLTSLLRSRCPSLPHSDFVLKTIGKGKDVQIKYGKYDNLSLVSAWKIEHPINHDKYEAARAGIVDVMERIEKKNGKQKFEGEC